jgi:hypothetical protein
MPRARVRIRFRFRAINFDLTSAFDSMATLPVVAVSIGQNSSDATGAYQVSDALAPRNGTPTEDTPTMIDC